jgi:hypothetical protein
MSGGRKLLGARSSTASQPTGGPSTIGAKSISAVSKPSPHSTVGSGSPVLVPSTIDRRPGVPKHGVT